ncbi:MAG: cob(I)yrinic acid a,c-diamide adenosyltransferase [Planctomycetaceae bacterium]
MVNLNRIYTRSGDAGETSLGDGTRVAKNSERVRAMGSVDELNSAIGLALLQTLPDAIAAMLSQVQNELFDLGADLSCPFDPNDEALRMTATQVERLETWIDQVNEPLADLTSFILPGGTPAAAAVHVARTICRRAELDVLGIDAELNPAMVQYINRLSDLLFVVARACNENGKADVLWIPGKDRNATS